MLMKRKRLSPTTAFQSLPAEWELVGAASSLGYEALLPKWLTAASGTESFERVSYLIRDLSGSLLWEEDDPAKYTISISDNDLKATARMIGRSVSELSRELKVSHALNHRLTTLCHFHAFFVNYVFAPLVMPTEGKDPRYFRVGLSCTLRHEEDQFFLHLDEGNFYEGDAVIGVLKLAEKGTLQCLRLCKRCQRQWIFARKKHYRFCSEHCRNAFFYDDPETKERKAAAMRRLRKINKERLSARSKKALHGGR
jgi:hypothetical protein